MRRLEKKGSMNQRIDVVLRKFRSRMSSYPPGMCPLSLYRSLLQISMNQSCGKCVPSRELPDEEYPLMLTTGRILYCQNCSDSQLQRLSAYLERLKK